MENPVSQIDDRIEALQALIAKANVEIEELQIARKVFLKLTESAQNTPSGTDSFNIISDLPKDVVNRWRTIANPPYHNMIVGNVRERLRGATVKEIVLEILKFNPEPWMVASDIQEKASQIKGGEVPMSTLSPTLTTLKDEGLIVRDGLKVAYAKRVKSRS